MMRNLFCPAVWALALFLTGACGKEVRTTPEEDARQTLLDLLNQEDKVYRDRSVSSKQMNRTMKYSVWLPNGYDSKKEYPFLYLLHGYGDDNNSWLDKGGAQAIAKDYVSKGGVPMVIVMPDGLTTFYTDGWGGNWESYFHQELMPDVEKAFHCNGKRAVAGLSMGGYGTLYNVLNHPDRFTYGYAMSPATSYGSVSLEDLVKTQKDPSVFPGITLESGTQDYTVTISSVRAFSEMLSENGVRHEMIERDGGHDWQFWPACLDKALVKVGETFK